MNQHQWDKAHDEWKTGNYGQDQFEEEDDEEESEVDFDEEIESEFYQNNEGKNE